eukprot:1086432-Karenia_brevis.AAC.1
MPRVLRQLVAEHSRHTDHEENLLCALTSARDMDDIVAKSAIFPGIRESYVLGHLYDDFCLHYNYLTMDSIAHKKLLYNQ